MKTLLAIVLLTNSIFLTDLIKEYRPQGNLVFVMIISVAVGIFLSFGQIMGMFNPELWKNEDEYEKEG